MTIELIDLDTGATMEVHNDKTSGLQFEGKPTERALRAECMLKDIGDRYNMDLVECLIWNDDYEEIVLEALELMAKEKTNG